MRSHSGIPEHHLEFPRNNESIIPPPLPEQNVDEEEEEQEEEGEDVVEDEEEDEEYYDEEPQIQNNDPTSFHVEDNKQDEQVMLSPNSSRDLDNSQMHFNVDAGDAFEHEEEMKNVDDPVIREMLSDWKIGNSFQEDERAQTVHGKRSSRPKNQAISVLQEPRF